MRFLKWIVLGVACLIAGAIGIGLYSNMDGLGRLGVGMAIMGAYIVWTIGDQFNRLNARIDNLSQYISTLENRYR